MNAAQWVSHLYRRNHRIFSSIHNGLAALGFTVLITALVLGNKLLPDLGRRGAIAFGTIRYEGVVAPAAGENWTDSDESIRNRTLANYLARRYRVASDATEQLVGAAHLAAQKTGLDPLLILAVMAIESRFNPIAESEMGAKGLMQVIPQLHQDKLLQHGGDDAVLDPATNILIGAKILKEYIRRSGSAEAGLQLYAGAASDSSGQYAQKVLAEKDRLAQALQRDKQPIRSAALTVPSGM